MQAVTDYENRRPYYFLKNGILFKRFTVTRAVTLNKEEEAFVKEQLHNAQLESVDKQLVLEDLYTEYMVKKGKDFKASNVAKRHFEQRVKGGK